jgi:anionic cell wall polymer biosynthesis LytR-Cps2A-Psr (LCP) family protein
MWLFHVYGREGFEGLHYYFQQVFDVDLQGIAYINMDSFEVFIDALGGILLPTPDGGPNNMPYSVSSGADVLEYLRNNDNNWGCYSYYDCEQRQFFVLRQMAEKIKTKFHENALVTAGVLWDAYGELFQTDLSEFEQVHWLVELGWLIATSNYEIRDLAKMDQSEHFKYGETPLEVRGWTVREDHDATNWITENLGG